MKKYIILILIVILSVSLSAEVNGKYGFQMLKIISGVSIAAQGGTGAFSTQEAFAFLTNPTAGIINHTKSISLTQNYWIFDTNMNSLGYSNCLGKTSFGISYRFLDYGKMD